MRCERCTLTASAFPSICHPCYNFQDMGVTAAEFRQALGCFGTGVTIITLDDAGEAHGMTANAFTSVSLDPMLVLVCVDRRARTHAHLHSRKRFGVNILAEDQQRSEERRVGKECRS